MRPNSAWSNGFVMKSNAPAFKASTAASTVPWAVSRMTGVSGLRTMTRRSTAMPSTCGMRRSVRTAAYRSSSSISSASAPSSAVSTS